MLSDLNYRLFMMINAAADAPHFMITFAILCANYLIYLPILTIIYLWLRRPISREIIAKILLVILVSLSLTTGTNFLFHAEGNSFPSKHTTFIFAIAFTLFFNIKHHPQQKIACLITLIIALLIGWSRIYLGIHWPFDIIFAIIISLISTYLLNYYWPKCGKLTVEIISCIYRIIFFFFIRFGITKY
ncbi:phosphatase PAP2 family protein [Frischella sp. Ac13]|uniref:undecaprenyl-diphosphate phosphatase n=1 Tax=Frischella japonica TaxID=2741544 RepID=A0ABR7QZR9_9GAMM|nr:phosphatase PAP2 family protein [Frischella japonica]MBC9131695.1 phosphatase PAP2 family protein [Frischella japonica]